MPQTESQRRASDAVAAWLAHHKKNPAWLVDKTGADPGTIGDFINHQRWPKIGTQGKIEDALGWPAGVIRQIGNGGDIPDEVSASYAHSTATVPVGANVDPQILADLAVASPEAIEAVRAILRATRGQ